MPIIHVLRMGYAIDGVNVVIHDVIVYVHQLLVQMDYGYDKMVSNNRPFHT